MRHLKLRTAVGCEPRRRFHSFIGSLCLSLPMVACTSQDSSADTLALSVLDVVQPIESFMAFATEEERAAANEKTVSCYAVLAKRAYEPIGSLTTACSSTTSQDTRNGMGQWQLQATQSPTYNNILKFWERTSGNRRELAIGMRGSESAGDWLRDAQSQVWFSRSPENNSISSLGTAPRIDILGNAPKFDAGFHDRVKNLAPEIAAKLAELERWRSQGSGREIGVKITGHSLGAATAQILGLYIADRYKDDNNADVEVFAFNSPQPVNQDMADTYRRAATDCDFNLHIFNNSQDVVSAVPVGASQIVSESDFGSLNYGRFACAYHGKYRQSTGISGMHLPSALTPLAAAAQVGANFVLSRHDVNQWILSESVSRLQHAPTQVAANWFPVDPMGGAQTNVSLPAGRNQVTGIFDANLFNATHGKFMRAVGGGGGDVRFDRTVASTDELFRFTPGDADCVRGGTTITIRPVSKPEYYLSSASGNLRALDWLRPQMSNTFWIINHTQPLGCIANNDVISLVTVDGTFLVAEADGDANANRTSAGPWERFTVRNIQNVTAIPAPGTEGWQLMGGLLKQISVGYGGAVWGVSASNAVYSYNGANGWVNRTHGQPLKYVSVGQNNAVWGIDASDNVYRLNSAGTGWVRQAIRMKQVSVGYNEATDVWGVDSNDSIFRWNLTGGFIDRIPGQLKHVSAGVHGEVWGVNAANNIYRYNGSGWDQIPGPTGGLSQITVGMGGEVWGIGAGNQIYRYNDPGWQLVPGSLKHISAGFHEEIWGVNASDQIYRLRNF